MRTFLGVATAVLGIGAIAIGIFQIGPATVLWQAAYIVAGVIMIGCGVSLVRSVQPVLEEEIEDGDMDYTNMSR